MFVRTLADVEAAGRLKVQWNATVQSARILTADDGMGFSLHENRVTPGEVIAVWYKHHWEANYIVSGRGRVEDLGTGPCAAESWALEPGILYNVGPQGPPPTERGDRDAPGERVLPPARRPRATRRGRLTRTERPRAGGSARILKSEAGGERRTTPRWTAAQPGTLDCATATSGLRTTRGVVPDKEKGGKPATRPACRLLRRVALRRTRSAVRVGRYPDRSRC